MPKLAIPSRFHSFAIEAFLGPGLSGEVYKARARDGSSVALKIFDTAKERDRTVFGYFSNEQLLLRELARHQRCPHLVEYVVGNLRASPYYLATRYVEGGRSLRSLLGRPLKPGLVARVVDQIGVALDYMHSAHPTFSPVVHRDVTPGNVLLDARGDAVLIDLSIARHPAYALEDECGLGTPQYMPPEQYVGEEVPATDQFALACVALHMLIGRPLLPSKPRAARKQLEALRATGSAAVRAQLRGRGHTADVLCKALAFEPAQRYASCAAFAEHLRAALVQDGLDLADDRAPAAPRRRYAGPVAMAAVSVAAAAVLLARSFDQPPPALALPAPTSVLLESTATLAPPPAAPAVVSAPTSAAAATATLGPIPTVAANGLCGLSGNVRIVAAREPLRAAPRTDAKVLALMAKDAIASCTGNQSQAGGATWYEAVYDGKTGWLRSTSSEAQQ